MDSTKGLSYGKWLRQNYAHLGTSTLLCSLLFYNIVFIHRFYVEYGQYTC